MGLGVLSCKRCAVLGGNGDGECRGLGWGRRRRMSRFRRGGRVLEGLEARIGEVERRDANGGYWGAIGVEAQDVVVGRIEA